MNCRFFSIVAAGRVMIDAGPVLPITAGQTVAHSRLHVIPRFIGDVVDPRGGFQWIIPAHAP